MGRWSEEEERFDIGLGELLSWCLPALPSSPSTLGPRLGDELGRQVHARRRERLQDRAAFEAERSVLWETSLDGVILRVHGRIDFLYRQDGQLVVEECKSTVQPPGKGNEGEALRARLQLAFYALALAEERPRALLVWVCLPGEELVVEELPLAPEETRRRLHQGLRRLLDARAARREQDALLARWADELPFPHPELRPGQAELMEAMESTFRRGERLLLEAPTGTGKTVAGLHAALRSACRWGLTAFFLTGRNTQRKLALATLARLAESEVPFFALALASRSSLCPHGEARRCLDCPLGAAIEDRERVAKALLSLRKRKVVGPEDLRRVAATKALCPFELALVAAEGAQMVVADHNYAFAPRATLARFFRTGRPDRLLMVVDEAHGLADRLLDGLTMDLELRPVEDLAHQFQGLSYPPHRLRLAEGLDELLTLIRRRRDLPLPLPEGDEAGEVWHPLILDGGELKPLIDALRPDLAREALLRMEDGIDEDQDLADFLASWTGLLNVASTLGDAASFHHVEDQDKGARLRLLCLDASPWIRRRWKRVHGVVAMSATLSPLPYFRQVLALDRPEDRILSLPSPFPPENHLVLLDPTVDTRSRLRSRELPRAAARIGRIVEAHSGRQLLFTSSFAVAKGIAESLASHAFPVFLQEEGASPWETEALLEAFLEGEGRQRRLLVAVLGGRLAEGIDFPDTACEGIILLGPGIPPPTLERELRRRWHGQRRPDAWEHCYVHPAVARLVQAAGRLLRRPEDRGSLVLMGRRFLEEPWASLLPEAWHGGNPKDLVEKNPAKAIRAFWKVGEGG